jgi:hypothetical protein
VEHIEGEGAVRMMCCYLRGDKGPQVDGGKPFLPGVFFEYRWIMSVLMALAQGLVQVKRSVTVTPDFLTHSLQGVHHRHGDERGEVVL